MQIAQQEIEAYERDGCLFPIDVFSKADASRLRSELESLEERVSGNRERQAMLKNNSNWVLPWFDALARNRRILGAVSSVMGPDLLALNVDLFVKEPRTKDFISWHQDLHYWGLDSDDEVTVWLALSPATAQSGCMRFLPGSHTAVVEHKDTFEDRNMLSRGQELAVDVDEEKTVNVELKPGQISLHHGRMFHASAANRSDDRRIGIAIRYVRPSVGLAKDGEKTGASLVLGHDACGNFDLVEPPQAEFEPAAVENWQRLRRIEEKILFAPYPPKLS
ncbi:MAG: phytanoyl-CoA dioxygenase family protein [Pseudomonadota bacterium]